MPSLQKQNSSPHSYPRVHGSGCSLIRTFRTLKGWKQEELAARSGIKQPTLSCFERGARTPTPEQKRLIALALEVAVEEIFPLEAPAAAPEKEADHEAGK